ncbi:hypothetical protein BDW59DRAFT_162964 [Aspergillus cavernicola]|uniref:Restriction endonuclease domain-containing protein n=1 Tax=Aspergillus cavernicola TaxID=176166 RepID=A0ABR4I7S8_9EURO
MEGKNNEDPRIKVKPAKNFFVPVTEEFLAKQEVQYQPIMCPDGIQIESGTSIEHCQLAYSVYQLTQWSVALGESLGQPKKVYCVDKIAESPQSFAKEFSPHVHSDDEPTWKPTSSSWNEKRPHFKLCAINALEGDPGRLLRAELLMTVAEVTTRMLKGECKGFHTIRWGFPPPLFLRRAALMFIF